MASATLSNGSTQTLTAGGGLLMSLGLMLTPLWIGDALGFGAGVNAGWKYDQIGASNGSMSLSRFPITGAAHMFAAINDRWYLLLRGGVEKDLDVSLSSSGVASGVSGSATGNLGGFGEGGF